MKKLKLNAALLALLVCTGVYAQNDGIPVTSMSRLRGLGGDARQFDQQSKLQYDQMLSEAHKKDVVATEKNVQLIRLRAIAKRLIPFTARWNPDAAKWQWEVNLLNSPTVNAFCMPGGRIAFYNGILTKLNLTDDEVAMVMGHEIAHALREHAREQAGKNTATSLVARIAGAAGAAYFGVDPRLGDAAAGVVAKGAALSYSRGDETEADLVGMDLAARAGFDPRAGIALWQKMGSVNKNQPLPFLSTHPSGKDRINEMNKNMHLVLPVFAKAKGLDPDKLPAYHSLALPSS
jgi:predicted Zn-dependent protease